MYSTKTGLILGFHGCDISVVKELISGKGSLKISDNDYDWLGNGIYFWGNSPSRALEYAKSLKKYPKCHKTKVSIPGVLGAVMDLGRCLDFIDYSNLSLLKKSYSILKSGYENLGLTLPQNLPIGEERDLLIRKLDCHVIQMIHKIKGPDEFDSVRGVFWEGKDIYPNAGFKEKNHIQICIRNPNCIKGYFSPLRLNQNYKRV